MVIIYVVYIHTAMLLVLVAQSVELAGTACPYHIVRCAMLQLWCCKKLQTTPGLSSEMQSGTFLACFVQIQKDLPD